MPTSTPAPTLTATFTATLPPTPTRTSTPLPTTDPTGGVPQIESVELRIPTGGKVIYQDIAFTDTQGDVNYVDYKVVSTTASEAWVKGGKVEISKTQQKAGAIVTGTWKCGNGKYTITLQVVLKDAAGHTSKPYQYTMTCK